MNVKIISESFMINFKKRLWSRIKNEIPTLAKKTGTTDDTIRKWFGAKKKDGQIKEPDFTQGTTPMVDKVMAICREKKISADWLFSEEPFGTHPNDEPQLPDSVEKIFDDQSVNSDDHIKNERDLYRELAEERKERIEILKNEVQRLKDRFYSGKREDDKDIVDIIKKRELIIKN